MKTLSRAILALVLIAGFSPAMAAPPPPVPSVQDIERRTQYTITASTCACAVNYSVFGDGTDYQKWVEVWLNGVRVNYNDASHGWTLTSPTGPVGLIPRPIIDAVITFNSPQTGTVQIVGARVPRRIAQFNTRNATSRDLDVAFSDLVTMMRETWDRTNSVTGRALLSQPGVTMGNLPLPLTCQNAFLGFDAAGNNPVCRSSSGTGNVTLPVIDGDMVVFDGIHGLLKDGGGNPKNLLPVYVDDYCAVVDGVTNNTACISAAITAANGLREVKFSSRAEYCVDPIKIGDGGLPVPPRMGGDSGFATTLVGCSAAANPTVTYSNFSFDTASSVHDLRIRVNGQHPTGLFIHGCQFCSFERIRVQGASNHGIVVQGEPGYNVQYNSFRDIVSRGNNGYGFRFLSINNVGDYYVAANHCSGLRSQSNLGGGIDIDYATVDCNGAELEGNVGYGLNTNHTKAGVWNPVHIEGNTVGGIKITAVNTTNLHFQGGRVDNIDPLLLSCTSCSIDQTDGAGQNNGFLRPTGIAVGATATDPSTGNINLGGGSLFNNGVAPVGSGAYVRATGPTVSNLQVTGSFTATGLVTNADMANPATTVNGQTCTLGAACTVTASASSIAIGTPVTGNTNGRVLTTAANALAEYTAAQLTAQINPATTSLSGAVPAWPGNTTTFFRGDGAYAAVGASSLSGATLASGVTASSLTSVGTLTGGATGAGFTVALTTSTVTGTLPCANHPALTGDITTSAGNCATTLATVASAGTTGSSTAIPVVTITAKGLVTGITTAAVVAPAGTLSGSTLAAGVTASSLTSLGTITSLTATTINAFTLGGTVSGGGNQINNVVIGASTPLAGTHTTLQANTSINVGAAIAPDSILTVNANTVATAVTASPYNVHIVGANSANPGVMSDAFAGQNLYTARVAFGTGTAPTQVTGSSIMLGFTGQALDNTSTYRSSVVFELGTIGAVTSSDAGGFFRIRTMAAGTVSLTEKARIQSGLSVGTTADGGVGTMLLNPQAFSALAACSSTIKGAHAYVTDSTTNVWGATITGTGANNVLASCNGTNWTVAAK